MTYNTPNTSEQFASHIPALVVLMKLGWTYCPIESLMALRNHSTREVVLRPVLTEFLQGHRFEYRGEHFPLSSEGIQQVIKAVTSPGMGQGLLTANETVYDMLTLGVTVNEFMPDGRRHSVTVPLVDWQDEDRNQFHITEEMEVMNESGTGNRRPDMVGFLNGIPVVVIEAKKAASGNPNKSMIGESISQMIRNQRTDEIPRLFAYSQVLLAISKTEGRYGTTNTPAKFWSKWQDETISNADRQAIKDQSLSSEQIDLLFADKPPRMRAYFEALWEHPVLPTEQDELLIGVLRKNRLLALLRYYILFQKNMKVIARYQQYFGIQALLERITQVDQRGTRKGGMVWHTTGSGKSFTMVYLSKMLVLNEALKQCRVVVVTDRVDLEKQLSKTFAASGALGATTSGKDEAGTARMSSGRELAHEIGQGKQRVVFTLVQKFLSAVKHEACYNPSENLLVLVDEGHRSHGGENHIRMKQALPNAGYIAFTGTPLFKKDKAEAEDTFGPIVHAYTMRRAVEDRTVTPLLYEERKPELDVNQKSIDYWFETKTHDLSEQQKADLKKKYAKRGAIYGAEGRIKLIANDIAMHFHQYYKRFDNGLKGQIACDSKLSAIRYKRFLDETDLVTSRIVISPDDTREGHTSVDEAKLPEVQQWWKDNVPGDPYEYERETIEHFGTDGDPDLLIVVDKLLTGFDEPRNAVLYIDKPLKDHSLIQAIARVNRLHEAKSFGMLIDYRGILAELDTALKKYQDLEQNTQGGFDIDDIDGLYRNVDTQYKQLPKLHQELWSFFKDVKNTRDDQAFRQVLMPRYAADADGVEYDTRQELRESFYETLTNFGKCFQLARSTQGFYEDSSFPEELINTYKRDLKFFVALRHQARQDAQETVDYTVYEKQVRYIVDSEVTSSGIHAGPDTIDVEKLGQDPEQWDEEKTRNEADVIRTRTRKTIEQELGDDPYAKKRFSELLKKAIEEAEALFDYPKKQYALFKEVEEEVRNRRVPGVPESLQDNPHARAYFGVFRLVAGDEAVDQHMVERPDELVELALQIEQTVQQIVAENSVNPSGIEAGIRKALLPDLFSRFGMDQAKAMLDEIIQIVRNGVRR